MCAGSASTDRAGHHRLDRHSGNAHRRADDPLLERHRDQKILKLVGPRPYCANERVVKHVRGLISLIIDEISMLSANTLTMVEAVCREVRGNDLPFGGMQVILVGDFFPAAANRAPRRDSWMIKIRFSKKKGGFCFNSRVEVAQADHLLSARAASPRGRIVFGDPDGDPARRGD
jgi:hypothetical protein